MLVILLENFKRYLPHHIVLCLNEKKVTSLASAAVLADEYTLTHKSVFSSSSVSGEKCSVPICQTARPSHSQRPPKEGRNCFCCHKLGRLIAVFFLRWPTLDNLPLLLDHDGLRTVRRAKAGDTLEDQILTE